MGPQNNIVFHKPPPPSKTFFFLFREAIVPLEPHRDFIVSPTSSPRKRSSCALSEPMKWHPEWLPRVSLILPTYWDRKIEWRRGGWDGLWEGMRVKGRIEVLWLKCSPDQQSEPSETWANSLFNPFSCFFSLSLSVSLLSLLTPHPPPSLSLFTISHCCPPFLNPLFWGKCQQKFLLSSRRGREEGGFLEWFGVCVYLCVCKCWLSEGGKC